MNHYLSLSTAQQLKKWGCDLYTGSSYIPQMNEEYKITHSEIRLAFYTPLPEYKTYDILWDVCIKYADSFFPEWIKSENPNLNGRRGKDHYCQIIMGYLQMGRKEEAEKYLLENCTFNPKNQ